MQDNRRRHASPVAEEKQFDERIVSIDRVARVVKGGRRFRFRALVVIGDHKGKVGMGISKGADVTTAVTKAVEVAKKNIRKISIYKGTLPHESTAKVSGAHVIVKPASAGTGLIAGGTVRLVLEVAGISNALSKSMGSSNKINVAYATLKALEDIKPANEWITYKPSVNSKASTKNSKKEISV
jgi:small subunit ribosomal protein S5